MLAETRAGENEEYGSDLAVKSFDRAIGECIDPKKEYGYIADWTRLITVVM